MGDLKVEQTAAVLRELGWRVRTTAELAQAVKNFQRGWNLGARLEVDGAVGPRTSEALRVSLARARAGKPTASAHFSFTEFACKCGGKHAECPRIWIIRKQLERLEVYRARLEAPVSIVSGCRCRGHNKHVGGAKTSQHLFGAACDVTKKVKDVDVKELRQFAGIGRSRSTRLVAHVDSRDVSAHNTTGGTPAAPTIWEYAS